MGVRIRGRGRGMSCGVGGVRCRILGLGFIQVCFGGCDEGGGGSRGGGREVVGGI